MPFLLINNHKGSFPAHDLLQDFRASFSCGHERIFSQKLHTRVQAAPS
jgi:hypothetical protein